MKYIYLIVLTVLTTTYSIAQQMADAFKLKWQAEIGQTTYRTNIIYDRANRQIVLGSNGIARDQMADAKDGVYMLHAKSGKVNLHIAAQGIVDGDVNGVALDDSGHLFFGNDDARVFCYQNGQLRWEYTVDVENTQWLGDIETCPVLTDITADGQVDVIITVEDYGMIALDGKNGALIWEVSRKNQPVRGHGLNSPAAVDVNGDGTDDLIWGTRTENEFEGSGYYGDAILAIDGKSGKIIWSVGTESAIHASPLVVNQGGKTEIIVAETYSTVYHLDKSGAVKMRSGFTMPTGGISGFFSSPVMTKDRHLVIGTSWWGAKEDGAWSIDLMTNEPLEAGMITVQEGGKKLQQIGRVSASAVVGDIDKSPGDETITVSESGTLMILDRSGQMLRKLMLPAGAEATPFLGDIDGDGKLEILVACLDGFLYCYDTKRKGKGKGKVTIGQFRVNNRNTGNVSY